MQNEMGVPDTAREAMMQLPEQKKLMLIDQHKGKIPAGQQSPLLKSTPSQANLNSIPYLSAFVVSTYLTSF